jgi:type VI secretion system protein ImpK
MPRSRDDFDSSEFSRTSPPKRLLMDLCTDAFLLIFHIHGGNDPGHPEELRKEISTILQNLEKQGKRHGFPEEDIKATRYAVCALLDETILNSRWEFKDQWADRPLQLEHFGEHMAGERFFDLLERIRQKGARKVDLLEVFCLTLILGFLGKYKLRGREELQNLIRELAREVNNYRGGTSVLSPHAPIPDEPVQQQVQTIPRWYWITGAVSVATVIVLFAVFKLMLRSDVGTVVCRMIF